MHFRAPIRRRDALCCRDEVSGWGVRGDELSDRPGFHHVVAEEWERVLQPLHELRRIRSGVHVEEVDAQADDRLVLRVHLRKGMCIVKLSSCAAPSAAVLVAWKAPWSRCVVTPTVTA